MRAPAHLIKTARRQMRKIRSRGPRTDVERRLLASADQQREQGLGWRFDGFAGWDEARLFRALGELGLSRDPASFRAEALEAGSPTALAERWEAQSTAQGKWRELPLLAARELWRRLLPGQRSAEVVADEIDELLEEAEVAAAPLQPWLRAARRLCEACVPGGAGDRAFFEAVTRESGSDLAGFMQEMPARLIGSPSAPEAAQLYEAFARIGDEKALLAERAEALALVGRADEALAQIDALLARFPDDPTVLLKAGAVHEARGDHAASQAYLRRYTEIARPKAAARTLPAVGPNDRCPCGSGKKYKRCHGAAS